MRKKERMAEMSSRARSLTSEFGKILDSMAFVITNNSSRELFVYELKETIWTERTEFTYGRMTIQLCVDIPLDRKVPFSLNLQIISGSYMQVLYFGRWDYDLKYVSPADCLIRLFKELLKDGRGDVETAECCLELLKED